MNSVVPGYIASSGMSTYTPEMQAKFTEGLKKMPFKRMGTEAEVSSVICFLLSEGASYVTGSCYYVHGGSQSIRQDWQVRITPGPHPIRAFIATTGRPISWATTPAEQRVTIPTRQSNGKVISSGWLTTR